MATFNVLQSQERLDLDSSEQPDVHPTTRFAAQRVDTSAAEEAAANAAKTSQPLEDQLLLAAQACGITTVDASRYEVLAQYCRELWKWNEKINLTRHTTPELFVHRDWLDSVRLAAQLKPDEKVLDFGSGSGVPGITVALLRPDVTVALCDSVQKKARTLEEICKSLKLPIKVHSVNVKDVLEEEHYDTLTARAVGSISKMLTWLKPYWHQFDRLLTIKGPSWVDERAEARHVERYRKSNCAS